MTAAAPPPTPTPPQTDRTAPQPFSITLTPCKMLAERIVPDSTKDAVVCDARGFRAILGGLQPGRDLLKQLAEGRYLAVLASPVQVILVAERVGMRDVLKKNPGLDRRVKAYWRIDQLHRGGTLCET